MIFLCRFREMSTCNTALVSRVLRRGCSVDDEGGCPAGQVRLGRRCLPDDKTLDYVRCFASSGCLSASDSARLCAAAGGCSDVLCSESDAVHVFEATSVWADCPRAAPAAAEVLEGRWRVEPGWAVFRHANSHGPRTSLMLGEE